MPVNQTVELPAMPHQSSDLPITGREFAAALPLRGVTVLAVEDSRFASEALRLMCQRLGARLRRAETLQAARSHLRLYRPNLVIIDLGLPDGRGEALIREMVACGKRGPVILGTSGDPAGRTDALAAGADGFMDKPLDSFAAFQSTLMRHLPDFAAKDAETALPAPDPLALRDDLAHAAEVLDGASDASTQRFVAAFLVGVARHSHDAALEEAAEMAASTLTDGRIALLREMIAERLAIKDSAFGGRA
jgi:CheY-like chemotaxis protein